MPDHTDDTTPPAPAYTAADAVSYIALAARQRLDYTLARLAHLTSDTGQPITADQLTPLAAELEDLLEAIMHAADPHFVDRYHDGRPLVTIASLPDGTPYPYIWNPDPELEEPRAVELTTPTGHVVVTIRPPDTVTITDPHTPAVARENQRR